MARSTKCKKLKEILQTRIVQGEYRYGERLPSGPQLAEDFGVSYVTITKTIKLLEQEGFLECRQGVGNFVAFTNMPPRPGTRKVNLICPAYKSESVNTFLLDGQRIFEEAGWKVSVLPLRGELRQARGAINHPDFFTVLYGFHPHFEQFAATIEQVRNRVVVVGERADQDGVLSVTSDEAHSIRLCFEHFDRYGADNTVLVCENDRNGIEALRIAAWQGLLRARGVSMAEATERVLHLDVPAMQMPESYVRAAVASLAGNGRLAAVRGYITPDENIAMILATELADRGMAVPEDAEVVSIGTSASLERFRPVISSVDNALIEHIHAALALLENRLAGVTRTGLLHICPPSFIDRRASAQDAAPRDVVKEASA